MDNDGETSRDIGRVHVANDEDELIGCAVIDNRASKKIGNPLDILEVCC